MPACNDGRASPPSHPSRKHKGEVRYRSYSLAGALRDAYKLRDWEPREAYARRPWPRPPQARNNDNRYERAAQRQFRTLVRVKSACCQLFVTPEGAPERVRP